MTGTLLPSSSTCTSSRPLSSVSPIMSLAIRTSMMPTRTDSLTSSSGPSPIVSFQSAERSLGIPWAPRSS